MSPSIHSPDELIAAIPHMLGFKPHESVVFVPIRSDLPTRIDLQTTPRAEEFAERLDTIGVDTHLLLWADEASVPTSSPETRESRPKTPGSALPP